MPTVLMTAPYMIPFLDRFRPVLADYGIELIVSDSHERLQAARRAVFPSVPWQRCQFHLQQNAGQYVP